VDRAGGLHLTTVAIFLPVLLLNDVEGQLFADLALTIACAVTVSMLVAVTVLPAVAARWMGRERLIDPYEGCGRAPPDG
jgi:multidrug efflux pump subunit AcrB